MLDTVNVTPSKTSTALQSPKVAKGINKPVVPQSVEATVSYGCGLSSRPSSLLCTNYNLPEHVQTLLKESRKMTYTTYTYMIQTLHARHPTITHTHRTLKEQSNKPFVSLSPTYLCLQCPSVYTEDARDAHFEDKGHAFCKGQSPQISVTPC